MATYKQICEIRERAIIDKDTQFDGVGLSYTTCNNIARMYGVNNQNGIGVSGRPKEIDWETNRENNLNVLSAYFSRALDIDEALELLKSTECLDCEVSGATLKLKVVECHFEILYRLGYCSSMRPLQHDIEWKVLDSTSSILWVNIDGQVKSMSRMLIFDEAGKRYRFNINGKKTSMKKKELVDVFKNIN